MSNQMKQKNLHAIIILSLIATVSITLANNFTNDTRIPSPTEITTYNKTASEEAFTKMMKVLTHKRCVNCHPAGNRPLQGEDSHIHNFNVLRGPDDHGVAALKCKSCHQEQNNDFSGVPGAPEWALAPLKMAWEGLNRVEIARSMMNPENNGGRTLEETVKHLTEHKLVLWAWEPGIDAAGNPREKPPVSKEEYIKAVKEWAAAGAIIPEK